LLDQSFSVENFRKIIDIENRKGFNIESKFFKDIFQISQQKKELNKEIRKNYKNKALLKELYASKELLLKEKEEKLLSELEKVSQKVLSEYIDLELKEIKIDRKKTLYTFDDSVETYFVSKQLQRNISRLYKVKQANRHLISEQFTRLLEDAFPKFIIRIDIKSFYESINQEKLLNKINSDNLLSPLSKRFIKNILEQYNNLSNNDGLGIPRGIGISAYLSELFLRQIDKKIEKLENISYYARYVDDIILIITPKYLTEKIDRYEKIINEIVTKIDLEINDEKTKSFSHLNNNKFNFDYLGYKYEWKNKKLEIDITNKKKKRFQEKLKRAFYHYENYSKMNEKDARKWLVKRIRFLTGNTRLISFNKKVFVGIYYSNPLLNNDKSLLILDRYMKIYFLNPLVSDKLKKRLEKYSFQKGFNEKRYSPFKPNEIKTIVKIWKNIDEK
jgi:hypothetical protein